jgi:hypothetical protein
MPSNPNGTYSRYGVRRSVCALQLDRGSVSLARPLDGVLFWDETDAEKKLRLRDRDSSGQHRLWDHKGFFCRGVGRTADLRV